MLFHRNKHRTAKSKKRRFLSVLVPGQLTSLINRNKYICERVFLCTSPKQVQIVKGSLTVEAAVILPLFLLAVLTLVCVTDICRIQIVGQAEVAQEAKQLSMYAYGADGYLTEEYIDLSPVKTCELPVSLIPGYKVRLAFRGRVHTWTGRSEAECAEDKEYIDREMVYVTDHQSVYHTENGCTYLELSIYKVGSSEVDTRRNEDGKSYKACEKCCGVSGQPEAYYISARGERYHMSSDCSGLIRKVRMIPREDAAHLDSCSRCGEDKK